MKKENINWQPQNLENNFVALVPLTEQDFERLYSVASDPLVWQQHPSANRYERNVFQEFFAEAVKSKTAFLILEKNSGAVIGSTRFYDYNEAQNSVAIGFTFLARNYWGGKYNRAVKELMLNYAFTHVDKVIFHIGATNTRSQIATSRFGVIKTSEFIVEGDRLSYEYTVNKDTWTAMQANNRLGK
jgi:RimJ/RimL family protein N-acetyltransferase